MKLHEIVQKQIFTSLVFMCFSQFTYEIFGWNIDRQNDNPSVTMTLRGKTRHRSLFFPCNREKVSHGMLLLDQA